MLVTTVIYKGIKVENAELSVGTINISDDKTVMSFTVNHRAPGSHDVFYEETFSSEYDIEGENPEKQAYEYLFSLPRFSDAVER
ncbi:MULTISPECIES: hypothetical protein [Klebsiella]|uniref:hypothetical protein n=1 Tax=Klebsiella TaxID=570 RepID=UPI0007CCF424|nr:MULTISPECIES: hypothetical protein [Klebsiella]MCW9529445.1 hypothetical protein [Klebsiella grimontii]WKM70941.1 hypothetical protein Q2T70_21530 [Klebsiella oxytoca]SAQ56333.1 Uncharacterised protein [Klebsiella grimontii]HED4270213.1 hypothetical protein [Klebsiella oxytoca]